jgi:hypothetical protein
MLKGDRNMALTTAYLTTTKNLEGILSAIQSAQAPEKFTLKFLLQLEYKSTADRLIIGVLKGLGFLDETSAPTERYFRFLDQSEAGKVLAEGIREAYDDLFRINTKAFQLTELEVKNKLKTLTQGQKSDTVLDDMAKTFVALCAIADWTTPVQIEAPIIKVETPSSVDAPLLDINSQNLPIAQLCYNIQIILPATRDTAVYDALFKSLKEHLLR